MRSLAAAAVLALAAVAVGQDPADDVTLALLRGDANAAARAAGRAEPAALRARLLASLSVGGDRAVAMLAVAESYPDSPEADRALLAGAAAVLVELRRGDVVPELAAFDDHDRRASEVDRTVLSPVVIDLRAAVAARRRAGGDAALLEQADRLLACATVSRHGLWPVRVPFASTWERPTELREPLSLRLLPCAPGRLRWSQLDSLAAPAWSAVMPIEGPANLPPLPAGDWLLEASSSTSPWRGMRRIVVSDLEAIALAQDGHLALAAFDPRGVVAAKWELAQDGATVVTGELPASALLWHGDGKPAEGVSRSELRLRAPCGTAWLFDRGGLDTAAHDGDRWVMHAMVDRPIYRPGETMQGRLVLRACTWSDEGVAMVPSTAPASCDVKLEVDFADAGTVTLPLHTDGNGLASFSCTVPAAADPGTPATLSVLLPETNVKGEPLRLRAGELAGVAAFQRQAVMLEVEGPESVAEDLANVDIAVRASWASGGPAAGLDVRAAVNSSNGWEREQALALRTDADGRAIARVPIAGTGARWVDVDFTVTPPDGKVLTARHRLSVQRAEDAAAAAAAKPEWFDNVVPDVELGSAVVGEPCRITLRGAPRSAVLVVVGRSKNARVHALRLGDDGIATIDEVVQRCDWPRFDVTAANGSRSRSNDTRVRLRAMAAPRLEVPTAAGPGTEVTLRVAADAPASLVTFAVVDERIYELAADRTPDPDAALRPGLPYYDWSTFDAPIVSSPKELLDSLLVHGRLPDLRYSRDLSVGSASGGAAAGGAGPLGSVRRQFRATAHFATVVADAAGVATTSFRLPDDLTRWRATAVVVGTDGVGAIARATFASRQPFAIEPVMPRVLRAGDSLRLPLAIDRAADATAGGDAAAMTVGVKGQALAVERAETTVSVPAGRVVVTDVPVHAVQAGTATLQLGARLGDHEDAAEHELTVAPDAVLLPCATAASATGEVTVPLPDGAEQDAGITVDVMAGGSQAWRLLEQDLARYPYGCAEQTLSRLLPYFALVRASKVRGEVPPAMDEAFGKRLRAGLARLRELQASTRHFAFWPGQEPDDGITALVLHGLALLREGGVDLQRSGLDLDDYWFRAQLPRTRGVIVVDATFVRTAELLAGALRLWPEDSAARSRLQPALEVLPQLPVGLCARIGLALHGSGDVAGARACRQRLGEGSAPALAADGFPGEDPIAIQAMRLELDVALHADQATCERAAAELLLACLRGGGSTYGRSCALTALALVLPRVAAAPATVVVEVAGERRELRIGGEDGAAARCRLPRGGPVTVRGPQGMPLLVRVAAERSARASDHAAWARPVEVQRQWCTQRLDAKWDEERDGRDLEPLAGPILVGRPLVLRLVLRSPQAMRHVVVDCPLPAGFDVARPVEGQDRFDDRVVFATDLQAGVPCVLRVPLVPTMVGRVVFPPVVAAPMYASGSDGGCAGGFVDVVAVQPGSVPALGTVVFAAADESEAPPEPVADWCEAIRAALAGEADSGDASSEEARAQRIEQLFAAVPPMTGDPFAAIEGLTELHRDSDINEAGTEWPERAWRATVPARLRAMVIERLQAAMTAPCPEAKDDAARQCRIVDDGVEFAATDVAYETLLVRSRQRAIACGIEAEPLVNVLRSPPYDPVLVAELRRIAATSSGDDFRAVWDLLTPAERALVPPIRVLDAPQGAANAGTIAFLLTTPAGLAEVRARLRDPAFVELQWARLESELPASLWAEVPLSAYAVAAATAVAEAVNDAEDAAVVATIVSRLTHGLSTNDELLAALTATRVPAWRHVLAKVLRARGAGADVAKTAVAIGDASVPLWLRAIVLRADDAAAASELLAALPVRTDAEALDGEMELLAQIPAEVLVAAATPERLYAARAVLEERHWAAAWARLQTADRIALLGLFEKHISDQFVPATVAEAEAVFAFFARSGDVDSVADVLTRSWAGIECARRHLLADERVPRAVELREAVAKRMDLDEMTLQVAPEDAFETLLTRLLRIGFSGPFSAEEARSLQQLREQRGL